MAENETNASTTSTAENSAGNDAVNTAAPEGVSAAEVQPSAAPDPAAVASQPASAAVAPPAQPSIVPDFIRQTFGFDYRAIAAFRIMTGIALILVMVYHVPMIHSMYTDDGWLPRIANVQLCDTPVLWSIYLASGTYEVTLGLFILTMIFGFMMMVGYKTNFATIMSFFMLISLHNRNSMVLDGGDLLLRLCIFWGFFISWGNWVSVDSYGQAPPQGKNRVIFNLGTLAFCAQILCLYWMCWAHKDGPEWRNTGMAGIYSLNQDFCTTAAGVWLLQFQDLVKAVAISSCYLELVAPLFLLLPIKNGLFKTVSVALLALFHFGLSVIFILGLFPYIDICALVVFLPTAFWDKAVQLKRLRVVHWVRQWAIGLSLHLAPPPVILPPGFIKLRTFCLNAIAAAFMVFVIQYNLFSLPDAQNQPQVIPKDMVNFALFFRIDQNWNMFSKFVPDANGWYVMPGKLADGREIDVWTGKKVTWERPALVSDTYGPRPQHMTTHEGPNEQWNIFLSNLWIHRFLPFRACFADYLCKEWNATHENPDDQLQSFQIYFMYEKPLPESDPNDRLNPEKLFVWEHTCGH